MYYGLPLWFRLAAGLMMVGGGSLLALQVLRGRPGGGPRRPALLGLSAMLALQGVWRILCARGQAGPFATGTMLTGVAVFVAGVGWAYLPRRSE